uniref:Molybdenum cofactor sulfurase n=2 Tax=Auxenochlorella protothecoides TaxID=3075 RepID=A0A1D2AGZ8_AUXPR
MRLGCTCNPGACYAALGVRDGEVADFAATKHDNWTDWEWITVTRGVEPGGAPEQVVLPLGSIRASLGALSRWEDVDALARFLEAKYVDRPEGGGGETTGGPIPPIDYC